MLEQLKGRFLFRIAAGYAVTAWIILQILDIVSEPLGLPDGIITATILILAAGFPVTLLLAHYFNREETNQEATSEEIANPRHLVETALLVLVAVGMVWLIAKDLSTSTSGEYDGLPVVVLMDTYAAAGVYDEETVQRSGTNADVLSRQLSDLPAVLQKEAIGAVWDREAHIVRQNPSMVVIHRSAFFHSMNQELGFGYSSFPATYDEEKWRRLYDIADNKLIAFLGYVAGEVPAARFIVYSRGTGGGWADSEFRQNWIDRAQNRFPALQERIDAIAVPGGLKGGSFKSPKAADAVRQVILQHLPEHADDDDAP